MVTHLENAFGAMVSFLYGNWNRLLILWASHPASVLSPGSRAPETACAAEDAGKEIREVTPKHIIHVIDFNALAALIIGEPIIPVKITGSTALLPTGI